MADHPVSVLRTLLADEFSDDLPEGVRPVSHWCADPQFFPGATGLIAVESWADVSPGSEGVNDQFVAPCENGVIVVGNYQATAGSYQRLLNGSIGGFPATWRVLPLLLEAVSPREVFLTNAFIGLPELPKDTAPFPTNPSFTSRCEHLLATEIELFRPRTVVCLGVPAAKMLAAVASGLGAWRPWPRYSALQAAHGLMSRCRTGSVTFVAVAVRHPSARISLDERRQDAGLIRAAAAGRV